MSKVSNTEATTYSRGSSF